MNKHSAIHAELIQNFRSDAALPGLDLEPLETLHAKIKEQEKQIYPKVLEQLILNYEK